MRFLSVCSGIEAASVAWNPLGWHAAAFAEIEPFPCSVLAHHYPDVPNLGDMTKFEEWPLEPIDLLCGGTPCQSFSVAGLRKGLADPRGNLMLTYGAIAARYRPKWLVWENVPGVLSSNGGRDFGAFLGLLGILGYGFAYRVLDAQFFGVPQRRRRVFVVGCLGDWRSAAAVLFERHSLSGHPAPRRHQGERAAPTLSARTKGGGGLGTDFDCDGGLVTPTLTATYGEQCGQDYANGLMVPVEPFTLAIRGRGDSHNLEYRQDGTANALLTPNGGRGGIGVGAIAFDCKASGQNGFGVGEIAGTQRAMGHAGSHTNGGGHQAVAYSIQAGALRENPLSGPDGVGVQADHAYTLEARAEVQAVASAMQVRRLTPRECARLQGFPDDYLDIIHRGKPAADGPKYKALGNSWAIPPVRWIGQRINQVEALHRQREEITA